MVLVLVVGGESQACRNVVAALGPIDGQPLLAPDLERAHELLAAQAPALVTVDLSHHEPGHPDMKAFLAACKQGPRPVPVLALIPESRLVYHESTLGLDDFISCPSPVQEMGLRMARLLQRFKPADEPSTLRIDTLVIDLARYEVTQDGKRMDLTFKEYELLKFLATNPGKVFTRENLLSKVWGYDYYGGTRTVDVHIRRLRSKIESGATTFIDTVRNVGYRFREPK